MLTRYSYFIIVILFQLSVFAVAGPNSRDSKGSGEGKLVGAADFDPATGKATTVQIPYLPKDNLVTRYLTDELGIKTPALFNLTLRMRSKISGIPLDDIHRSNLPAQLTEAELEHAKKEFSPESARTVGKLFAGFIRTRYNHVALLGEPGVGKTHSQMAEVLFFSYGVVPPFLRPYLGLGISDDANWSLGEVSQSPLETQLKQFAGGADIFVIDKKFLSEDNTKNGKPFPTEDIRISVLLNEIFEEARKEYQRSGHRTIFLLDEVARLKPIVKDTLIKLEDETGYRDPFNPIERNKDSGLMVQLVTTPGEYLAMIEGDMAIERRHQRIFVMEPDEEQAFNIVNNEVHNKWRGLYNLNISEEALEYIIRMRKLFKNPKLAMPDSVLKLVEDLFISIGRSGRATKGYEISLRDAQEFVVRKIELPEVWLPGPNGEPPFWNLEEKLKEKIFGQDDLVRRFAMSYKTWARLGFSARTAPLWIIGGPPGSGKSSFFKWANEVIFGHDGSHLRMILDRFDGGYDVTAILKGPPIGNRDSKNPGRLATKMNAGRPFGILFFDEIGDTPSGKIDELNDLFEHGRVESQGTDGQQREFPMLGFGMAGQYGEELFSSLKKDELTKLRSELTQEKIDEIFKKGVSEGRYGAISDAILDRAHRTGGVDLFFPVSTDYYPAIVKNNIRTYVDHIWASNRVEVEVDESLVKYITAEAIHSNDGPRMIEGMVFDFLLNPISEAQDSGLTARNTKVRIRYVSEPTGDTILLEEVITDDGSTEVLNHWPFDPKKLRRQICVDQLTKKSS